jgi:hypothetical protein
MLLDFPRIRRRTSIAIRKRSGKQSFGHALAGVGVS